MSASSDQSEASNRVAGALAVLSIGLAPTVAAQTTERINVSSTGAQGTSAYLSTSISANGNLVAFDSDAGNLVSGDTNLVMDVFVRDRQIGTTERVSVGPGGAQGNGLSRFCSISANGRYVAFFSDATNLVSGDTNARSDVFVHDRQAGTTECASLDSSGAQGNGPSWYPSISADGRYVVFLSLASNLVGGDTNGRWDVFVRDRQNTTTERVNVDFAGGQGNLDSGLASISGDGRFVAFRSLANNLVSGDTNGKWDIFVRDRQNGTTERASVDSNGAQGNMDSDFPAISADARFVAFMSLASNLVSSDTNGVADVFVRDLHAGTTERTSIGLGGSQTGAHSYYPSLSADGRFVAFYTSADNLVAGDTNASSDAFVHDRQDGSTERVSVASSGTQGNGTSEYVSISANGTCVAFSSTANNLVTGDTNGNRDAFVRDRRPASFAFCFGDGIDTSHTTPCPCANDGAAGNGCANSVHSSGANLTSSGSPLADDVRLEGGAMPDSSTCIYLQGDALEDVTFGDGVRCTGGNLIRLRARANIAGLSSFPDSTDTITLSARGGVTPGGGVRRFYQTYYRNAAANFCPPETFNVTNGMIVDW